MRDIFASPTVKQDPATISAAPSEKGTIWLIKNYTGDYLRFELAKERALQVGLVGRGEVLKATEGVSIERSEIAGWHGGDWRQP